ncbi:hypothetical protein DIPPA_05366 [Diplonema papillatum]|nr:hypothetical protein DIPPA_05366 [Diplonema papillatum]
MIATNSSVKSSPQDYTFFVFIPRRRAGVVPVGLEHPPAIIVEHVARPKKMVSAWLCSPKAKPEHPAIDAVSPVLQGEDKAFFTDWVHSMIEALWATEC